MLGKHRKDFFPQGRTGGWEGHSQQREQLYIGLEDSWFVPGSEGEECENET